MSIIADIGDKCDVIVDVDDEDDCITWYGDGTTATAVGDDREQKPLAGTAAVGNVDRATDDWEVCGEPSSAPVTTRWSI